MQRRELNRLLDWVLLLGGLATFATGLVLLFRFHMGHGPSAAVAWGVPKLVWVNIHRLGAALVVVAVVTHVGLHWRAFRARLAKVVVRRPTRRFDAELLLYAAFLVAAATGLAAWLLVDGSSPLFGPAVLGRATGVRHPWLDVHHVSSLVCLALVVHHLGHRWRFMVRRERPATAARPPAPGVQAGTRGGRTTPG